MLMKLLIITQKVDINDDVLGFFHNWIEEFAKHCESVIVICLQKGEYDFPENVKVLSLGKGPRKENAFDARAKRQGKVYAKVFSFLDKIKYSWNFYKYIWKERKNYDAVFVHMNPEYVVLGGLPWRLWNKKTGLWYAHGTVNLKLRLAEKLADIIFTSTESGFHLASKKKKVVGQGIDTEKFKPRPEIRKNDGVFKIISIGRISPVKDYETLINAIEILAKGGLKLSVDIVGATGLPKQEKYLSDLKKMVAEKNLSGTINFSGSISNKDIAPQLQSADLFVNMSHTKSLDKAILEAMACGLPVLTCNEALKGVLGEYETELMYPKKNLKALAEKIKFIMDLGQGKKEAISVDMREIVVKNHGLENFIGKICSAFSTERG